MVDLTTDEGLAAAARTAQERYEAQEGNLAWQQDVTDFIAHIAGLDRAGRASEAFHHSLWDDNPISAVGMGRIDVDGAIADAAFRDWLAEQSLAPLPSDPIDDVPARLPYPRNLALVGTVNMDETTHGLSDKVLDRAFTIELWDIRLDDYPRWGARTLEPATEAAARALLSELMPALRPVRLHFGWRVVDDVLDFLAHGEGSSILAPTDALDEIVYAKVLPKLRGDDSPRFQQALDDCRRVLERHGCRRAADKVQDLLHDLEQTGSARFWR